jgi:hypothetical protein
LSITVPFGSLQTNAFDEAEPFRLQVDGSDTAGIPLKDHAKSCHQGLSDDDSWSCVPTEVSHEVCGHSGTLSFESAEYVQQPLRTPPPPPPT